jgi:hypothetical protein
MITVVLVFFGVTQASATIPDLTPSHATAASGRVEIEPDGSGPSLSERGLTISVTLLVAPNTPVAGYPWQDIYVWNLPGESSFNMCQGGAFASANTDAQGKTTIEGPFAAGGCSNVGLQVYIAGVPLDPLVSPPLDITVVSADLNGDLTVDLDDLVRVPGGFANLFLNGGYDWEVDLNTDDVENILDVVRFAELFLSSASCP